MRPPAPAPSARSSARLTMSSATSSAPSADESTTIAPSATRRGLTARVLSLWSRARTSSSTRSGLISTPRAASSSWRRRARSSSDAVRKTLSSASGHTTVPTSRPSDTHDPSRQERTLRGDHLLAHPGVGRDLGHLGGDLGGADRLGHVAARDAHPVAVVSRLDADRLVAGQRRQRLGIGRRDPALLGQPGDRAVHGPGVEVGRPEPPGDRPRDRALARAGGPVDRHDHAASAPSATRSRAKRGYETATASKPRDRHALAAHEAGRRAEHRQAVVAGRARSPRRAPPPVPVTSNPSSRSTASAPMARSAATTVAMRSLSFTRSSAAPRTTVVPDANAPSRPDERQLVDHRRDLVRRDLGRPQALGARHDERRRRAPRRRPGPAPRARRPPSAA